MRKKKQRQAKSGGLLDDNSKLEEDSLSEVSLKASASSLRKDRSKISTKRVSLKQGGSDVYGATSL